jgi:hypothetical protein
MRDYEKQIEIQFTTHSLSVNDDLDCIALREKFGELGRMIDKLVPDSLEKSKAITGLNVPMFWAVAGIARKTAYEVLDK